MFGGQGNLTRHYEKLGDVTSLTKVRQRAIVLRVWSISYALRIGFMMLSISTATDTQAEFFPLIFEMIKDEGLLIFTFPVIGVHCVNGN